MAKRYFWLKLKMDFFKRNDIQLIESNENGKDYVLFYLKLLCESLDNYGSLRFSETIPYDERMLSIVTGTNIDVVRSALKLFVNLKMIDILDDQTIFMNEIDKMLGSESKSAERVRKYRSFSEKALHCNTNVTKCNTNVTKCNRDIDIDIDIDKTTTIKDTFSLRNEENDGEVRWKTLTEDEQILWEMKICELFAKMKCKSEPYDFIAYNNSRDFIGIGGENVLNDLPRYIELWERKENNKDSRALSW